MVCPSCGKLVGVQDDRCFRCGRANPGMWGWTPVLRRLGQTVSFSSLVIGICVVVYLATLVVDPSGVRMGGFMNMLGPSNVALFLFGSSGVVPVFEYGRWWSVLSATWLHGSLVHILFNMLWVRQIGPQVAQLYGPGRTTILWVLSGVAGFAASSCAPFLPGIVNRFMGVGAFTVGASASLFGLFGALVHFTRRSGDRSMSQQVWAWVIALFAFGFFIPGVDNWAHLGGFLGGWGLAIRFDPATRERTDHLIGAVVCVALSLAALVVSIFHALPLV